MSIFEELEPFKKPEGQRRKPLRVVDGDGAAVLQVPEAEEALLSILIQDTSGIYAARCLAQKLTIDAFSVPAHRTLAEKIFARAEVAQPVDAAIIQDELRRDGTLAVVGGAEFIVRLLDLQPTPARFCYFMERVRDVWLAREAVTRSAEMMEVVRADQGGSIAEIMARFALKFQRMADYLLRANRVAMRDLVEQRRLRGIDVAKGKIDSSRWVRTGWSLVDQAFLPFDVEQEDWYNIFGGPPSGGKSSVMRGGALGALDDDKRVAVFLLETSYRWIDAAAATRARVNLRDQAEWLPEHTQRWSDEMEKLRDLMEERLWVFQDLFAVEDIERAIREINRQLIEKDLAAGVPPEKARGLDVVVLDYLQLMTSRNQRLMNGPREQIVSTISRQLKQLFKGLGLVSWVGAQINRDSRNAGAAPTLTALRESGAIEQDADRVIFVHTPAENRAGQPQDGTALIDEVQLIQRKSRNGPRDVVVTLNFHKQFTLYTEAVAKGDARPGAPKPAAGYKREGSK